MKRLALLLLVVLAVPSQAANLSLLDCADFTGTPVKVFAGTPRTWAASTASINFQGVRNGSAITTIVLGGVEYQALCGWGFDNKALVGVRKNRGRWTFYPVNITCVDVNDEHYTLHVQFDTSGKLHLLGNAHVTALVYYVSDETVDNVSFDGSFSSDTMLGNESDASYPVVFRDRGDNDLYVMLRLDGGTEDSNIYFYHDNAGTWEAGFDTSTGGKLIDGLNSTGVQGVYLRGVPAFSADWDGAGTGWMHVCWIWRSALGSTNNHSLSYAKWNPVDGWKKSSGADQTIPITLSNCEIVDATAEGGGMPADAQIACDANGRPHIVYMRGSDVIHRYFNGTSWVEKTVGTGLGGVPSIVVKSDLTAIIVGRDAASMKIKTYTSGANDYASAWTLATLYDVAMAEVYWHGHYDPYLWMAGEEFITTIPYETKEAPGIGVAWELDENTGNRFPAIGATANFELTNNNTTTGTTGKLVTASHFVRASNQYLSCGDHATLSPGGSFGIRTWVKFTTIETGQHIVSKYGAAGQRSFLFSAASGTPNVFQWRATSDGSTLSGITSGANPTTATWYHAYMEYNAALGKLRMKINDAAWLEAAFTGPVFDSTADLNVGRSVGGGTGIYVNGDVDDTIFFTTLPTEAQITADYNSGSGQRLHNLVYVAPTIYSHGATASVDVDAGNTAVATVRAYGDLTMGEALTGTDAADFNVTDNGDGTWSVAFDAPAVDGEYEVTLTLDNAAGTDATAFTVTVTGGAAAPSITSNATANAAENQTTAYTATATGSPTPTFSITGGADADAVTIDSDTGVVTFESNPNFEAAADADANGTYVFQVTATNSEGSDALTVTVTVTDVNEAPTDITITPN